jgi:hypothetical protein
MTTDFSIIAYNDQKRLRAETLEARDRGYVDGLLNAPGLYGRHLGMKSTLEACKEAYRKGYEAGQAERKRP